MSLLPCLPLTRLSSTLAASKLLAELDGVDVASYPPVAEALCNLLEWLIGPAYKTIDPMRKLLGPAAPAAAAAAKATAESLAEEGREPEPAPMDIEGEGSQEAAAEGSGGAASAAPTLEQPATPAAAVFASIPILRVLGLYLHWKPTLLVHTRTGPLTLVFDPRASAHSILLLAPRLLPQARMCRLLIAALPSADKQPKISDAVDLCIDVAILPALTVSSPNPGLVRKPRRPRTFTAPSRHSAWERR